MSITSIISAIGNTSSVYPLIMRDCAVENPSKVYLTYKENKDDKNVRFLATRERIIDEYSTSAVWLGGIPFVEKMIDKFVIKKNGFSPAVSLKLLKEDSAQGLNYNVKLFEERLKKGLIPEDSVEEIKSAINDLKNVKKNTPKFEKLLSTKFLLATSIPIAFMGFVIPKAVFALTAKTKAKQNANLVSNKKQEEFQKSSQPQFTALNSDTFASMKFDKKKDKDVAFTGGLASTIANFTTYQKMATVDGGYAVGRLVTSRKKNESVDLAFKMLGMMFLNYIAPKYIEKVLDGVANKALNLDVNLDPLMFEDKELMRVIADKKLEENLPSGNDAKSILKFIDENPDSVFTKSAAKFEKITLLKNNIRDPRAYVDVEELVKFKTSIEKFGKKALEIATEKADSKSVLEQVEKFAKKAKTVKSLNILTNVGFSSFLLAYCLPKVQYAFREWYTGSKLEPGIVDDKKVVKS